MSDSSKGRLAGQVAIVTGGNSGIGEATAQRFAAEGARVAFCARRVEQGRVVEAAIRGEGGEALFVECDVTDSSQVEAFVAQAVEHFGGLDVVVNNAGSAGPHQWPDEPDDAWHSIFRLNVDSVFYVCRSVWPHLIAAGGGSIVNIGSLSAVAGVGRDQIEVMGYQPSPSYQASKAAVEGLTLHLAGRGGEHGIRVNCLRPGRILTRQWEEAAGEDFLFWPFYQKIQMLKQHGRARDVADAALYFASSESQFVTSQILDVNGGAVARV
jgi:NAD(P)-dependent dehydrogenase (short-subunit alcohol dehydrogenase family)